MLTRVVIGKGSTATKPRPVSNDDFVLVDIPKYAGEWPQLCQVVSALVKRFQNDRLDPMQEKNSRNAGKKEAWTEKINKQQILSSAFKLTPSGDIPKKVIRDELESCKHHYYMYHP